MSSAHGYRVVTSGLTFECDGAIEKVDRTYLLRLKCLRREVDAVHMDLASGEPVEVIALVLGGPVLAAHFRRAKARQDGPVWELACLLIGPEA